MMTGGEGGNEGGLVGTWTSIDLLIGMPYITSFTILIILYQVGNMMSNIACPSLKSFIHLSSAMETKTSVSAGPLFLSFSLRTTNDHFLGYEEALWMKAAERIKAEKGVVIAEEMAPLLPNVPDLVTPHEQSLSVDESFMLPLLLRFNGSPQLTESGHIYYRFDEMESSSELSAPSKATTWSVAMEKRQPFSKASSGQLVFAFFLGVMNFVGIARLQEFATARSMVRLHSPLLRLVPALRLYSISYLAIPLLRALYVAFVNKQISARNHRRQQWLDMIANPPAVLASKLQEKRGIMSAEHRRDSREIVYNTAGSFPEDRS